jgi:hypothetical protein
MSAPGVLVDAPLASMRLSFQEPHAGRKLT